MKVCVIGCGDIARAAHGPALRLCRERRGGLELAACCDRDGERAQVFARECGFAQHFADHRAMLEQVEPDAVLLLTPLQITAVLAAEILEAGIPLLLEKPPGRTADETRRLIEVAKRTGTPQAVAFNRRWMPLLRELKAMLRGKRVQAIHYELYRVDRRDADFSTTAIHGIDAMRFLAGSGYGSARFAYQYPEGGETAANIYMHAVFQNGVHGTFHSMPLSGVVAERAVVHWEGHVSELRLPVWGGIDYKDGYDAPGSLETVRGDKLAQRLDGEGESFVANGFYHQLDAFLDSVQQGRMPQHTLSTALDAAALMDCMRGRETQWISDGEG